ncbi:MAG TPA: patatin-like phospholipase family protein [Bryobacteraceae bacterium]|nr:patatin-like phospholipase family protein [Bryobacteraceae bacterium]
MPKQLAITVSGAVSLGSYEAGVLYEVLYAIGQHNHNPQTSDDEKIYIDVLTGASAGGMSIALAAQKLLYDADALSEPYNNTLYQAWVVDIDISSLLQMQKDEPAAFSILSSDCIVKLSQQYLNGRYNNGPIPLPKTHPAIGPEKTLRLGLALSNLNGVDYARNTLAGAEFVYSRFADEVRRTVGLNDDNVGVWRPIAETAVACGAFPFAFRPQDVARVREDFDNEFLVTANLPNPLSFTYTDGGVFQNEPLGLAKDFVDEIDRHLNTENRAYLFVSPESKLSVSDHKFSAKDADFHTMLGKLWNAIFYQSRFEDWIRAEEVNEKIDLFNQRAGELKDLFLNGELITQASAAVSDVLLKALIPFEPDRNAARSQLRSQFSTEYAQLASAAAVGHTGAEAWIDAVLALEMAADLHEKDEMYIYTITAAETELAGAQLMSFLGFLDQNYRQHDYDIGRTKAQAWLSGQTPQGGPLPPLRYLPLPIRPINTKLAGCKIQNAPIEKREALRDQFKSRVDIALKEANLPFVVRKLIETFYIDRKINQFLGL